MEHRPRLRVVDARDNRIVDPTRDQIHNLMAGMDAEHWFVILERLDLEPVGEHYMQVAIAFPVDAGPTADNGAGYRVEYRAGGEEHHYGALVKPGSKPFELRPVAELFDDWAHERPGWRDEHQWHRVELDD